MFPNPYRSQFKTGRNEYYLYRFCYLPTAFTVPYRQGWAFPTGRDGRFVGSDSWPYAKSAYPSAMARAAAVLRRVGPRHDERAMPRNASRTGRRVCRVSPRFVGHRTHPRLHGVEVENAEVPESVRQVRAERGRVRVRGVHVLRVGREADAAPTSRATAAATSSARQQRPGSRPPPYPSQRSWTPSFRNWSIR